MLRTVVRRSDIDMDKVVMLHVDSNFAGRLILEGFRIDGKTDNKTNRLWQR